MSEPKRPYEQIPYPTGSDPSTSPSAADVSAQRRPSPLPRDWPDVPWTPDVPPAGTPTQDTGAWAAGTQGTGTQGTGTWGTPTSSAPTSDSRSSDAPSPPVSTRNPWKWVAAGLAVLLLVVLAAIVGRLSAPSSSTAAQPAPSLQQPTDPDSPFTQGPLFTPDPGGPSDTFTPAPGAAPTFYSGRGNAVVSITKDPGPAIVQFECDKCTGNTVLKSDGPESVLVNAIGGYSGRRPIDLREGSITTTINVGATSDWRMTVSSGLGAARSSVEGAPLTGQGDDVVIMNGAATKAHVTNAGAGGFIVYVVPVRSATVSVAVNTTGAYDGTVALSSPAVVIVQSTGSWTIAPS